MTFWIKVAFWLIDLIGVFMRRKAKKDGEEKARETLDKARDSLIDRVKRARDSVQ